MSQACPIAFRQIDGTVARINAVGVSVMLMLFLFSDQVLFLYLLAADFAMRLYGSKAYSPINRISIFIKNLFGFATKMTDAGAKRLAAQFGLLFVVLLIIAWHFNIVPMVVGVSAVFLTCIALEILFNFCVGCKIYFIIKKLFPKAL